MVVRLVVEDGRHHRPDEEGEVDEEEEPVPGQEPDHRKTDELHQERPRPVTDSRGTWTLSGVGLASPLVTQGPVLVDRNHPVGEDVIRAARVFEGDDPSQRLFDLGVR